jgi:hypothetical protein
MAIDLLLASGTLFGACHVALLGQSKMLAGNAGVSAEQAAKEWTANVIPGITIIPSGTWGVNRALKIRATRAKKQTRREVGPARIRTIRRGAASLPARRTYVLRRR